MPMRLHYLSLCSRWSSLMACFSVGRKREAGDPVHFLTCHPAGQRVCCRQHRPSVERKEPSGFVAHGIRSDGGHQREIQRTEQGSIGSRSRRCGRGRRGVLQQQHRKGDQGNGSLMLFCTLATSLVQDSPIIQLFDYSIIELLLHFLS